MLTDLLHWRAGRVHLLKLVTETLNFLNLFLDSALLAFGLCGGTNLNQFQSMQPFSCGSRIWFSVRRHEQGHERKQLEEWLGQSNSPFERQTDKLYNWKTISQLTRTNCVFWRTLCSWKNDWCRWRLQREERLGPVTTVEGRTRADNSGVGKMTKADNSAGTDVGAHYILWQILVACCPVLYFIISRYDGGLVQLLAPSCRVADLQPETMWPTKGRQLVRRTTYEYKGIISALLCWFLHACGISV